ncbi:uncharacterized protein [Physcomitrium patens]|uniref:uncharacterized protein isoform X2 n=1 Tax=Physcomitrium patens TaxID=3218 RepID=UPI003CCD70DE
MNATKSLISMATEQQRVAQFSSAVVATVYCLPYCRESGELETTENKWKLVKHIVQKYPPGLRSIVVKAAGMSINHSSGFHRPKFTSVKLQFVPLNEVPLCIDEPACKKFSHF